MNQHIINTTNIDISDQQLGYHELMVIATIFNERIKNKNDEELDEISFDFKNILLKLIRATKISIYTDIISIYTKIWWDKSHEGVKGFERFLNQTLISLKQIRDIKEVKEDTRTGLIDIINRISTIHAKN